MRIYSLAFICAAALMGQPMLRVDVEVTDKNQMLSGFQKEDFEVFDQKSKQQIASFSQGSEPLDLMLMVDVSLGLADHISEVLKGAHAALGELRQGDRVAVMAFSDKTELIAPFSGDMAAVERTLATSFPRQHAAFTHILVAVEEAVLTLMQLPDEPRRRGVLMVKRNAGIASGSRDSAMRDLWLADILLSGLVVPDSSTSKAIRTVTAFNPVSMAIYAQGMSDLAARTGGDVQRSGGDPGAAFVESIKRIRQRYSLLYVRPQAKPGQQRSIEVKLSADAQKRNPHAKVLARTGYWIPKS
jgi:VWFA-related protein